MNHISKPKNLITNSVINFIQDGHFIIARTQFNEKSNAYEVGFSYKTKTGEKSIACLPQKIIDKIVAKHDKFLSIF